MMQTKILDSLGSFLLTVLICFSLIYGMTATLGIALPVYAVILTVAVLVVIFRVAFSSKLSLLVSGLVLLIAVIYASVYILFDTGLAPVSGFIFNYFSWLYDLIMYGAYSNTLYGNITFAALCVLFSAYYYAVSIRKFLFLPAIIPGIAIFSVQSAYNGIVTYMPFHIFLFTLILCYLKHIHGKKLKSEGNDYLKGNSFLLWVMPLAIMVVLGASAIQASDRPLEWKWLDRQVNAIYNYFYKKFDYVEFEYFSVANSGFGSRNNILGGRVRLDNTLVLTVKTDRNVYLKGATYDEYTGSNWISTGGEKVRIEEPEAEKNETLYFDASGLITGPDMSGYIDQDGNEIYSREKIKVVFQNIRTKSLFLPGNIMDFSPVGKNNAFLANPQDETLVSEKRLGPGFTYELEYLAPRRSSEDFINMLRNSRQGLNLYSSEIKEKYLRIPETVPQRVYDLASSLTVQCVNDYDRVKALEQYLAGNYPYNLDVGSKPKDRDFVDYFLFDQKEGYCTYYASALTIMARCLGIPARYTEGYIMPPKPSEKNENLYYVTNNQAHAWTEIYFEGFGWLPFEATSPFRSGFYSDPDAEAVYSSGLVSNPGFDEYMEMMKKYSDGRIAAPLDFDGPEYESTPYDLYIIAAIGLMIIITLSVLLFNSIRRKIGIYRLIGMEPKESVINLYKYFLSVLSYMKNDILPGETPLQYCERIDRYFYFRPVKFKEITEIFTRSRYGAGVTSEKERQILADFVPRLYDEAKNEMGRLKYFILRRVFGKF